MPLPKSPPHMSIRSPKAQLAVLYEHPQWFQPLFAALERRGMPYDPIQLSGHRFDPASTEMPAPLVLSRVAQSSFLRESEHPIFYAEALLDHWARLGARVLNGADVFALELSKSAQATLLRTLDIDCPYSITFNDVAALRGYASDMRWPALLKPDQGGSGARIQVVDSLEQVDAIFAADPGVWLPDNLFLLQEYLPHDPDRGIVRLEFLGGDLLYAMRVVTHGRFNLCPSPVCNPDEGAGSCELPLHQGAIEPPPVEFYPFSEVPRDAVDTARQIVRAAKLDVGGIEYLETENGRRVFYDINANSNLRPSVAAAFGFDPFERVVDFLERQLVRG